MDQRSTLRGAVCKNFELMQSLPVRVENDRVDMVAGRYGAHENNAHLMSRNCGSILPKCKKPE